MTRFSFHVVASLALWAGEVIAQQVLGDFTYSVDGEKVAIIDYREQATGKVVIPVTIDGKQVTSIGNLTFAYCTGVTSVAIPDSVTSISYSGFNECTALTAITVEPSHPTFSSVDGILFNKDQTTLIQYPGGKAGSYTIPNSVTSIREHAFYFCPGLTSVTIPNSVTSIGRSAFARCPGLTGVTIGNSVTSIGQSVFARCTGLTSMTIPGSLTSIGNWAFIDCAKLTSVYFEGNAPKAGAGLFTGVDAKELKLHIYEGSTGFELAPWGIFPRITIKRPGN